MTERHNSTFTFETIGRRENNYMAYLLAVKANCEKNSLLVESEQTFFGPFVRRKSALFSWAKKTTRLPCVHSVGNLLFTLQ
jgi:hypothetical protein